MLQPARHRRTRSATPAPNYVVWGNVAGWSSSYYVVWGNTIQSPSGQYVVWGNNEHSNPTTSSGATADTDGLRRLGNSLRTAAAAA